MLFAAAEAASLVSDGHFKVSEVARCERELANWRGRGRITGERRTLLRRQLDVQRFDAAEAASLVSDGH